MLWHVTPRRRNQRRSVPIPFLGILGIPFRSVPFLSDPHPRNRYTLLDTCRRKESSMSFFSAAGMQPPPAKIEKI